VHDRNGLCQFVVDSDVDSIFLVRELLAYLPESAWSSPPIRSGRRAGWAGPWRCGSA